MITKLAAYPTWRCCTRWRAALAGAQLPPDAAEQVARATSAILAEALAAAGASLAGYDQFRSLLAARQARLEHAAADAVASAQAAAQDGSLAALRLQLQWFETLTSAMWTVQRECASPLRVIRAGV